MAQNAAEGMKDVRSVNAEQGCSHTERRIVCNSNKLVHLTSRITALRPHYIFIVLTTTTLKIILFSKLKIDPHCIHV